MPELPEVETIRLSLQCIIGLKIDYIEVRRGDIIRQEDFPSGELHGQTITGIRRRGKYLALELANGLCMVVHMGMSGRFYLQPEEEAIEVPHVHLIIHLENQMQLIYQDARRFGGVWLCRDPESLFTHMGVEPLSKAFTAEYLAGITHNRKVAIKTLLLNQNLIAGIGNIYADEALFSAGIRGDRQAGSLLPGEIKRLRQAIIKVLRQSIKQRGTTFRDFRDGFNRTGSFQESLQVYGKAQQTCPLCGNLILKEQIGGRSSHYCPQCQK